MPLKRTEFLGFGPIRYIVRSSKLGEEILLTPDPRNHYYVQKPARD